MKPVTRLGDIDILNETRKRTVLVRRTIFLSLVFDVSWVVWSVGESTGACTGNSINETNRNIRFFTKNHVRLESEL